MGDLQSSREWPLKVAGRGRRGVGNQQSDCSLRPSVILLTGYFCLFVFGSD